MLRSRQFQSDCIWSPTYQFKGQISLKLDSIDKSDMSIRMTKMKDTTEIRSKEKVVLEINCSLFEFTDFPFDSQICSVIFRLWQYRLWSFQVRGTKLERFLPKDQHTRPKETIEF